MASWNNPALANKISDDVPAIKALLAALCKWTDADTTDVPSGAKRLQSVTGGVQLQSYSGSSWASVGKLIHDCDTLDGKHATASATADSIPVRDANGRIAGDVTGNANTATTASGLASGYVVPVANGGTGANSAAGARTNLGANNAANITAGVLAIERGGTGSGTKNFVDLSTDQTIGGNKTFSGEVTLNRNVLKMAVLDTTENSSTTRTDTVITGISSNSAYGISAMFGAAGNAVIGAGEGKASLLAELAGNAGEDVYIIADGAIHFHPNANTYANRKSILLNAAGELSGLAKVTATSFVGALTGNAATATKLATARTINIQDSSATNTGTGASFDGSGNATIKLPATIKASITGNCSGSSGSCTGNAATATKATQDSAGQQINTTYIKALSVSGKTITYTKGNGTTGTITTQDTNTTYSNFVKSGSSAAAGLVPKPSTTAGTTKYLREDCSWQVPPNTTYTNFVKSGSSAKAGLVPKPSTTAGTTKYLREDCSWQVPPNTNTTYSNFTYSTQSAAGKAGLVPAPPKWQQYTQYEDSIPHTRYHHYVLCGDGWKIAVTSTESDKRLKCCFTELCEDVLDAWEDIKWCSFKFKKDVQYFGDKARIFSGLVVQDVQQVFESRGLKHQLYSLTYRDVREEIEEEKNEDGKVIVQHEPAVDEWHMDYFNAFAIEAAYQRRRASRAEARIAALEERLARMESKLN